MPYDRIYLRAQHPEINTVNDLIVNLKTELVETTRLDDGQVYDTRRIEIGHSVTVYDEARKRRHTDSRRAVEDDRTTY